MIKASCIADFKLCEEIYIKLPKEIKSNIKEIELNDIPCEFDEYKKDETEFLKSKKYFCIKLFNCFQNNELEKIEITTLKNPIASVFTVNI